MERKYYKVLLNGESFHGGNLKWSLPKKNDDSLTYEPGDWMSVAGPVQICVRGLHLTSDPKRWFAHDADVYEVEIGDGERSDHIDHDEKIAVEKCRLVRPLTRGELRELDIFVVMNDEDVQTDKGLVFADGNATVRAYGNAKVEADGNAKVEAYGNATVRAYGNATVRADGNATVRAYGNATVRADGNATVRADGNATVRAYGNATVRAYGNAKVEAYGNAKVEAYGNATVRADGNAKVEAYGNATVRAYGNAKVRADGNATVNQYYTYWSNNNSTVTVSGDAVLIDRRSGKPVITMSPANTPKVAPPVLLVENETMPKKPAAKKAPAKKVPAKKTTTTRKPLAKKTGAKKK